MGLLQPLVLAGAPRAGSTCVQANGVEAAKEARHERLQCTDLDFFSAFYKYDDGSYPSANDRDTSFFLSDILTSPTVAKLRSTHATLAVGAGTGSAWTPLYLSRLCRFTVGVGMTAGESAAARGRGRRCSSDSCSGIVEDAPCWEALRQSGCALRPHDDERVVRRRPAIASGVVMSLQSTRSAFTRGLGLWPE